VRRQALRPTPLGALVRGLVAGAAGTTAMDLVVYRRYRADGGAQALVEWEFSSGLEDWEGAAAPAQVGRRLVEGLFQVELAPRWARLTNNVMHWGYGLSWGAQYGLVAGSERTPPSPAFGLVLGAVAFGTGYVVLPAAKLYKPIWEYDRETLVQDLVAHLAFGLTTASVFRILSR
jgi:hypothetical protein